MNDLSFLLSDGFDREQEIEEIKALINEMMENHDGSDNPMGFVDDNNTESGRHCCHNSKDAQSKKDKETALQACIKLQKL